MTIGQPGEILDIAIADDWSRYLNAADIGPAVIAAMQDAESLRAEAIATAAEDSGIREKIDAMQIEDFQPSNLELPVFPPGPAMPLTHLIEEAHQLFEGVSVAERPREFTGEAELDGTFPAWVTLGSGGIISCGVDSMWAATASGSTIALALKEAYGDAQRKWAAAGTSATGSGLVEDALKTLASMLNQPQGGN